MPETYTAIVEDIDIPGLPHPLPPYTVDVRIYKKCEKMQRALAKASGSGDETDTGGAFTPNGAGNHIGTLWLSRDNLDHEVLIHESVHVGVRIAQVYFTEPELTLSGTDVDVTREELVAYTSSKLAVALLDIISKPVEDDE